MLLGGVGVRAGKGGGEVVRVPQDNTDSRLRDRPFVCVGLNLRRLVRGESECYKSSGLGRVGGVEGPRGRY